MFKKFRNKSLLFHAIIALGIFVLFKPAPAMANIALDKVVLTFAPDERPVQNITVTNHSDKPTKVTGTAYKITNSGQPSETEAPAKGIALAPKAFELEPGQSRMVRLVVRDFPENMEDIYRVRFKPDTPEYRTQETESGTSVKIGVIMSMGALVMVQPKVPQQNLVVTRDATQLHFHNQGNTTVQLQREDFCNEDRSFCVPLEGKRIYPGMEWDLDIPQGLENIAFTQTILVNGNYSTLAYPLP